MDDHDSDQWQEEWKAANPEAWERIQQEVREQSEADPVTKALRQSQADAQKRMERVDKAENLGRRVGGSAAGGCVKTMAIVLFWACSIWVVRSIVAGKLGRPPGFRS